MNINIPQKQREEFDRAAALAIEKETFTPSELAAELEISEFIASIMVGYMEKAGLVTKGKGNDVRRAKITSAEWQALDCKVENFIPEPEPEAVSPELAEAEPLPVISVADIIPEEIKLCGKVLFAEDGCITVTHKNIKASIPFEDISYIVFRKCGFFRKGSISFSPDKELPKKPRLRVDTLCFKRRQSKSVYALAVALADRLEAELIEY